MLCWGGMLIVVVNIRSLPSLMVLRGGTRATHHLSIPAHDPHCTTAWSVFPTIITPASRCCEIIIITIVITHQIHRQLITTTQDTPKHTPSTTALIITPPSTHTQHKHYHHLPRASKPSFLSLLIPPPSYFPSTHPTRPLVHSAATRLSQAAGFSAARVLFCLVLSCYTSRQALARSSRVFSHRIESNRVESSGIAKGPGGHEHTQTRQQER